MHDRFVELAPPPQDATSRLLSTMSDWQVDDDLSEYNSWRTELCRFWWRRFSGARHPCSYAAQGLACPFAHDPTELRYRYNHTGRCRHSAVYNNLEAPLACEHWILKVRDAQHDAGRGPGMTARVPWAEVVVGQSSSSFADIPISGIGQDSEAQQNIEEAQRLTRKAHEALGQLEDLVQMQAKRMRLASPTRTPLPPYS